MAGRKPGYISTQRKFGHKTKVARVPQHWDVTAIYEALEVLESELADSEAEIQEARERSSKGEISNRFAKLADKVEVLRDVLRDSSFKSE